MNILSYQQKLNMKKGVMQRTVVCKDGVGRITRIQSRRVASMADPHVCAIKFDITPVNYTDTIRIRSAIDGTIINDNVPRYRQLNSKHLAPVSQGKTRNGIYLHVQTRQSKYQIVMNAKTKIYQQDKSIRPKKTVFQKKGYIAEIITLDAKENTTYSLEKLVSLFTSLDEGVAHPRKAGSRALAGIKSFKDVLGPNAPRLEQSLEKSRHSNPWRPIHAKSDETSYLSSSCGRIAQ